MTTLSSLINLETIYFEEPGWSPHTDDAPRYGLSPSSINTFLTDPLAFVLRYYYGLVEEPQFNRSTEGIAFGHMFHGAVELWKTGIDNEASQIAIDSVHDQYAEFYPEAENKLKSIRQLARGMFEAYTRVNRKQKRYIHTEYGFYESLSIPGLDDPVTIKGFIDGVAPVGRSGCAIEDTKTTGKPEKFLTPYCFTQFFLQTNIYTEAWRVQQSPDKVTAKSLPSRTQIEIITRPGSGQKGEPRRRKNESDAVLNNRIIEHVNDKPQNYFNRTRAYRPTVSEHNAFLNNTLFPIIRNIANLHRWLTTPPVNREPSPILYHPMYHGYNPYTEEYNTDYMHCRREDRAALLIPIDQGFHLS